MPRPDTRPPGAGDVPVGRAPAPPLKLRFRRRFVPRVVPSVTLWHAPHPVSVFSAAALGDLYGRGINGHAGTISTGASRAAAGAAADPATGYAGYAQPPQLFTGWNPAAQAASGTPIRDPGGLPGTSLPLGSASPLDTAMVTIMQGSS